MNICQHSLPDFGLAELEMRGRKKGMISQFGLHMYLPRVGVECKDQTREVACRRCLLLIRTWGKMRDRGYNTGSYIKPISLYLTDRQTE